MVELSQTIAFKAQNSSKTTSGSSISPLIVHGFTNLLNLVLAGRSIYITKSLWSASKVAGMSMLVGPSIVFRTISALFYPQAIKIIFLAALIVWIPIVIACLGTFYYPLNPPALSTRVILCRWTNLVMLFLLEGG